MLLDTNVVSELYKVERGRVDAPAMDFFLHLDIEDSYISAITVMELERGVRAKERRDPEQGRSLRQWLDYRVIPEFRGRILPVDYDVARECGRLHVPSKRSETDALIAATAIVHGLTVATRNVKDFEPMGVPVINPWRGHPVPRDVPAARGAASSAPAG